MKKNKSMAAAISAVMAYMKTEEDAISMQASIAAREAQAARPPEPISVWGLSGRQAMMQMRNLMQLKGLQGAKFH
ncbi:MAG: hypothetical protein GY859_36950 [Desulfobacterales bacterium]|nr:hypothetical protein [Desulfobacterales bacterium]